MKATSTVVLVALGLGCLAMDATTLAETNTAGTNAGGLVHMGQAAVGDLLQRFGEARDKMKSFVLESRGVTKFDYTKMMKWAGTSYNQEELRYDGNRSKWMESIWGNVSKLELNVKESRPDYTSHLWDGEADYYYAGAIPPRPGSVTITRRDDPRRDRASDGSSNLVKHGSVGEIMGYHWADNAVRLDELLKNRATQLQLREKTDLVGGVNCQVIDAVVKGSGKYTIWIDPVHDFHIARIQVRRGPGDHILKELLPGDEYQDETVELSKFEKVGEMWFPKDYVLTVQNTKSMSHWQRHIVFTKVMLNPDHQALKSFLPDDIANGTPVRFRDLPPKNTFIWRDGKVLDQAGKAVFDSGLKGTNADMTTPAGKK